MLTGTTTVGGLGPHAVMGGFVLLSLPLSTSCTLDCSFQELVQTPCFFSGDGHIVVAAVSLCCVLPGSHNLIANQDPAEVWGVVLMVWRSHTVVYQPQSASSDG